MRPRQPDTSATFQIILHAISLVMCLVALSFALWNMLGGFGLRNAMTGSIIAVRQQRSETGRYEVQEDIQLIHRE